MEFQKFLERLFHIDSNTSATIIITFLIFFLGYLVATSVRLVGKYFERRAKRKIFIGTLKTLIESLKKREETLATQLHYSQISNASDVVIAKIQFFQFDILSSIGYTTTFQSFFYGVENFLKCNKQLRTKAFIKVWENLANIQFWDQDMYEKMPPFRDEINRLNENMGESLQKYRHMYEDLFDQYQKGGGSVQERKFIEKIGAIVTSWQKLEDRRSAFNVNEFLSKPLTKLCTEFDSISVARELRKLTMNASVWYDNIEVAYSSIHKGLTNFNHAIKYFKRSTKKIILILR
jgi:hypothetical protein